jgi:hypothetical protein
MQAGPWYRPVIAPCGSIWASTRIESLLRKTTLPCGPTVSVHFSLPDDWTVPLAGAGACAAAGMAKAKIAAVKTALVWPDILPPFLMFFQ